MQVVNLSEKYIEESSQIIASALFGVTQPTEDDIVAVTEMIHENDETIVLDEGGTVGAIASLKHNVTQGISILNILACKPNRQRNGLGGILLDAIEERAALVSPELHLRSTPNATKFYDRQGYTPSPIPEFTHMKKLS